MSVKDNSTLLGNDLKLDETGTGMDLSIDKRSGDINLIFEEMNLSQAILNRFKTGIGELADIGYPDYGSEIYELLGEPNTEITRNRLANIIRATLIQESRIQEITRIVVQPYNSHYKVNSITEYNQPTFKLQKGYNNKISVNDLELKNNSVSDTLLSDTVYVQISIIPIGKEQIISIQFPFKLDVI
jgi:phage baseplate assembly protein W